MARAIAIIHCAPALGVRFTQYTAEIESDGMLGPAHGQRFVYVVEGKAIIDMTGTQRELESGAFAYLPENRGDRSTAHR